MGGEGRGSSILNLNVDYKDFCKYFIENTNKNVFQPLELMMFPVSNSASSFFNRMFFAFFILGRP